MSRFASRAGGPKPAAARTIARTTITLAAALLAVGAVSLSATPVASAATYRVHVCSTPDGTPLPLATTDAVVPEIEKWSARNFQPFSAAAQGCGAGAPIALYMASPGAPSYSPGLAARWRLSLPAGVQTNGVTVRRSVSTVPGADHAASPEYRAVVIAGGVSQPLESCAATWGCQLGDDRVGDSPVNEVFWKFPANPTMLELFVHCGGSGGCASAGRERVIAAFHRFEFEMGDSQPPSLQLPTGTLYESGNQSGVRSQVVGGWDSGSGLDEVVTSIDGTVVHRLRPTNNGECVDGPRPGRDYRSFTPCTTERVSERFELDSRKFADGPHTLEFVARDAAGNTSDVSARTITFENFPPPKNTVQPQLEGSPAILREPRPGDKLTAAAGKWEGAALRFTYQWQRSVDGVVWGDIGKATNASYSVTPDDIGKRLRAIVTATNVEGATAVATEQSGEVKSGAVAPPQSPDVPGFGPNDEPSAPHHVVDREQRTVEVKHGAKIVITGRLIDADGDPIANATVDVFEQLVLTAAPWNRIDRITTDSQGSYVFRPKTTASRRLRFAYADQRDASNYRATREVMVAVQAGMSISAKRKVVNPRGTIRLRGRVTVDNIPKGGTWVEVQVLDAGAWRTVATRKTSSKGLWTFNHRLRQSSGITFRFRSRLRVVGDVPSAEAKSTPVKVRIR